MKRDSKKVLRSSNAKTADRGRVRLGSFSPSFAVSAPAKKIRDKGKVRLGSFSPSF